MIIIYVALHSNPDWSPGWTSSPVTACIWARKSIPSAVYRVKVSDATDVATLLESVTDVRYLDGADIPNSELYASFTVSDQPYLPYLQT